MAGGEGIPMSASLPENALDIILLAGRSRSREELFFTIVNRSVTLCRYDRASLWSLDRRPAPLAVSGAEAPDRRAAFASSWSTALRVLRDRRSGGRLGEESFAKSGVWRDATAKTGGLSALWFPVPGRDAGILFERWEGGDFSPAEEKTLADLTEAYALVWRGVRRRRPLRIVRALVWLVLLAGVAAALALVRVPLRVVAMCEVTARNPRLISAPMDGVVEEFLVTPGQRVKAGERLALYDSQLMDEELKISRRQVAVVEEELSGARARGFSDARYRGEISILEARLEQENARLEALEARYSRRVVTAPVDGMVQIDDARAWRGRPVSTGQALMWLVDPEDTRATLWLPQDDRIEMDFAHPIYVHLNAMGGEPRSARLTYVSSFAQSGAEGGYAFPAEADWLEKGKSPPLGLRGTASIYGEETSLGYWLLRRPMAWARRWLGV